MGRVVHRIVVDENATVEDLLHELIEPPGDTLAIAQKVEQFDEEVSRLRTWLRMSVFIFSMKYFLAVVIKSTSGASSRKTPSICKGAFSQNSDTGVSLQVMFLENLQKVLHQV